MTGSSPDDDAEPAEEAREPRAPGKELVLRRSAELVVWAPRVLPFAAAWALESFIADAEFDEPTAVAPRGRAAFLDGEIVPEVPTGSWSPARRRRVRRAVVGAGSAAAAALVACFAILPMNDVRPPGPGGTPGIAIVEAAPASTAPTPAAPGVLGPDGQQPPLVAPTGPAAAPGAGSGPTLNNGDQAPPRGSVGGATPGTTGSPGSTGSTRSGSTGSGSTGSGSTGSGSSGSTGSGSGSIDSGGTSSGIDPTTSGRSVGPAPVVTQVVVPSSLAIGSPSTFTASTSPSGAGARWVSTGGTRVVFSPNDARTTVATAVGPTVNDRAPVSLDPAQIAVSAVTSRQGPPLTFRIPVTATDSVTNMSATRSNTGLTVTGSSAPTTGTTTTTQFVNIYGRTAGGVTVKLGAFQVNSSPWTSPSLAAAASVNGRTAPFTTVIVQSGGGGQATATVMAPSG